MSSDSSLIAKYLKTKLVANELRDQAIAAFLLAHADEYIEWVDTHVTDAGIKGKCLGFVSGVQAQFDDATLIAEHGQKMQAISGQDSGLEKLQRAVHQALGQHPVYGPAMGITSQSKDSVQA